MSDTEHAFRRRSGWCTDGDGCPTVTCDDAGVVLVAAVAGVADAGRGGGEGPVEAARRAGGLRPAEQRVQLFGDSGGGGQRGPVPGPPPGASPGSRPPARVVTRRPSERHCKFPQPPRTNTCPKQAHAENSKFSVSYFF